MNFTDEALRILSQQMGEDLVPSRAELESRLARLLGLVLQTGRGHPSLMQWVQRTLRELAPASRFGFPVDAKWAAPRLARLLCVQLLHSVRAQGDTVVQRQTAVA